MVLTTAVRGKGKTSVKLPTYNFPSFIFAGIGVAFIVLGIAGMAYGVDTQSTVISAIVAALGLVQVIYGGMERRGEDATSSPAPPADAG